jgi:hypothetical protein
VALILSLDDSSSFYLWYLVPRFNVNVLVVFFFWGKIPSWVTKDSQYLRGLPTA